MILTNQFMSLEFVPLPNRGLIALSLNHVGKLINLPDYDANRSLRWVKDSLRNLGYFSTQK